MKLIAIFIRGLFKSPYLLLALTIVKFVALLLIAIWLTPPIPCNTYVQGAGCALRDTTSRHLAEIGLSAIFLAFVSTLTVRRLRNHNTWNILRSPLDISYGLVSLALAGYVVFAIIRLVQAG